MTSHPEKNVEKTEERVEYLPLPLERVPEVNGFLENLGFGSFETDTVTSFVGRNDNWSGTTTTGAAVFVKQLGDGIADQSLQRMATFEELAAIKRSPRLRTPALLGTDPQHRLVAFELLPGVKSGAELAVEDAFDESLCHQAAQAIASIHQLPAQKVDLDTAPHPLPPLGGLRGLSLAYYMERSFAEIETWQLLQSDPSVIEALHRLRENENVAQRCPIHADVRLDQFLIDGTLLYMTDFEEFRLGDPARDVGGFIGEWLFRAIHGIPKSINGSADFGHTATHDDILSHGVTELARLRPLMATFWNSYLRTAKTPQHTVSDLAVRSAAFAGWHMIDRMIAHSMNSVRLSAVHRASAGIGRTILLSPTDFTATLGLEDVTI
ncbi:class V lanthionine synthetase subunit LxmK [Streptomyces sp. NPDC006649]|uniref:class V lanthionine synthetase subunit LxmK n=1 Tax=Streptomyces sp. NPDC006649 TaxID=3156896 RepID=UPI0033AEA04C